jgi:hypothetical protein
MGLMVFILLIVRLTPIKLGIIALRKRIIENFSTNINAPTIKMFEVKKNDK